MGVASASGTKLHIGTTAAVMATDTFVEVGSIESLGEYGIDFAEIKFEDLGEGAVFKFKGARDDGNIAVGLGQDAGDAGQIALRAAALSKDDYNFKIVYPDAVVAASAIGVSMTSASPGVVTDTAHGLAANTPVKLVPIGAGVLPTGIVSGTTYYVKTVASVDSYTLSATPGGSVINTTGSPSGTYTRTTVPADSYDLFKAKVMSSKKNPGGINSVIKALVGLSLKSESLVETARVPL